ncbi:MAG TPA: hypothetical protein VNL34_04380 [Candidatus Nitrosotenuis sp.]|jgi:hypothetical protein|nr:hypothetical protein [Candidatus Nitrosotenuis sp.]
MQKFALFFLLLITASAPFVFEAPILAQESIEPTDEEMMDETMMEGETPTDETMTDEDLADDAMMEDTMDDTIVSPLRQLMTGTDPHEIQCKTGQHLVFKASNWRPACINESSLDILMSRGWISSHDPSHEDLMKMMEGIPKLEEKEMPEDDSVEIEEDVVVEEETIPGNETEAEPQNYTIELRESMDMGAQ